ncbi:conserved hypothetical protein [Leishmania mexicana MHOM/GT/2001/U1103]|uniref:Uncharacterized protein n=1 Tax=Leishmania mexicana (strain MHOM/GT/2001/U1103) TaxID=929439 RepID=E9B516_LEIMU|nr:conserved hypothetical protein [Leishmania mexicana MHOM/GT/2001/U1103]CBZ30335.1 conserved hypothetical protein [Leishmania mexicana MHOM/GT/2001/U1103]
MQQVFPEDPARGGEGKPFIHFPIPSQSATTSTAARKRSRSPAGTKNAPESSTATSPAIPLSPEERAALCRFMEYGNQPRPASEWFSRNSEKYSTPAQLFANHTEPSRSALAPQHRWCVVALRQAMSLLCRFVQLDSSGYYLRAASPSNAGADATAAAGGALPLSTEVPTATARVTTLELYCRFQALELELEDAALRAEAAAHADAVPESIRQQLRSDVDATVACIEQSLNALECTLVQMLLGSFADFTVNIASTVDMSLAPSLEYVARMLRELPSVLRAEQWPSQFVCDINAPLNGGDRELQNAGASTSSSSSVLERTLLGISPLSGADAAISELLEQLGGATTSLALRSLFDLCHADVWNLLGVAAASPISRLAALEKLAAAASSGSASAAGPYRPVLDVETFEFKEILVRAWNRQYGCVGLRRLFFEMQVLFYQYAMQAQATSKQSKAGSGAALRDVCGLWAAWRLSLQKCSAAFLAKLGAREQFGDVLGASTLRADACDLMRQHSIPVSGLAEVQRIALRVITKVQAVDAKGWFAVPAFDLVNVDFTSVRYWILSPVFARKSKREAYRSLCRTLERMVDSCVQKYGPTHAFSDAITTVRQQLVDVARAEGLL